jgi:hypothetical protein
MTRRRPWLVATNLALAGGVVAAAAVLPAGGQGASRVRGQYTMVAGNVRGGGEASAVYIVDSINEEVIVVRWNDSRAQLDWIDYRSLGLDAERRPGR